MVGRNVREGEALVECAGAKQVAEGRGHSGWEYNKDEENLPPQVLGHQHGEKEQQIMGRESG